MTNFFQRFNLLLLLFALPFEYALGQCFNPVSHTSGSAMVGGCTDVTVTSSGSTSSSYPSPCLYGPFYIGGGGTGSFTFTFSPPISGVSLNVQGLDHWVSFGQIEEMIVEINGVFYPIVNPGVPDGCLNPAIIWPPGTIRGPIDNQGSWQDITIMENISTLKIEDNWVIGSNPGGISVSLYLCCGCLTDAGEITSNTLNLCPGDLASVPPAEQTVLDNDDILQYILFSDLTDTLGSIINTNSTPEFAFNPITMQFGTTYYIAAIAGNDLGGNVDLNDPCLDISNAIEVAWHPLPTVMFSTPNANICPGDCMDIEIDFTGTPPFQLSGEVLSGTNIISTFSQTYLGTTGTLTVCLPPNTALGSLDVNATELIDDFCTCD